MRAIRVIVIVACAVILSCILGASVSAVAGAAPKALLYGSGYDSATGLNVVEAYDVTQASKGPIRTLTGLTAPSMGLASDAAGNLYASQADPNQPVVMFEPGKTTPSATFSNPLDQNEIGNPMGGPTDVAVGADGTVYVSTQCVHVYTVGGALGAAGPNCGVLVYRKGKTKPSTLLTDNAVYPGSNANEKYSVCGAFWGVAVDAKGDVYSTCNAGVIEFAAGSSKAVDTGITAAAEWRPVYNNNQPPVPGFGGSAWDIQIDSKGNLVVLAGLYSGDAIFTYAPGADRPSNVIPLHSLQSVAAYESASTMRIRFDAAMTHIFVNHTIGSNLSVDEYTYPGGKLVATFDKGVLGGGMAISPPPPPQP
jgi:hypothetical protein